MYQRDRLKHSSVGADLCVRPSEIGRTHRCAPTDFLIVAAILLAAFLVRLPLMIARDTLLVGDEVVFGLMAKHILRGEFPIYYWGQAYMGPIESYVIAFLSLFLGLKAFTVQLGSFFFYELFLAVNYFLIKRLFGLRTALFTSLLLVVAPLSMMMLSFRTLGAYSAVLFMAALAFLFWLKAFEDRKRGYLIPLGLTLGLGLWMNSLFIMFLIPFALMTFFHENRSSLFRLDRLLFLKGFPLPLWLKVPFLLIHLVVAGYVIREILILGSVISSTEPAFQWKGVKKILALLAGESAALAFFTLGWRGFAAALSRWWTLAAGFLVGCSPALLYGLLGGEGYRILHRSGAIPLNAFGQKFQILFLNLIPKNLWGLELPSMAGFFLLALFLAGLFYFVWTQRNCLRSPSFFFYWCGASVLVISFVSTLVADRYLEGFYWVSVVAVGTLLARLSLATRGMAAILVIPFIVFHLKAAETQTQSFREQDIYGLIDLLEKKGIQGGVTDYDNAYRINFYSNERLIFIPLEGMMRRPEYRDFVSRLKQKTIILPADSPNEKEFLAARPDFKPRQTWTFQYYRIFIVNDL